MRGKEQKQPFGADNTERLQSDEAGGLSSTSVPILPQEPSQSQGDTDECYKLVYIAEDAMFGVLQELAADGLIRYGSPQVIDACCRNWTKLCGATYLTTEEATALREAVGNE